MYDKILFPIASQEAAYKEKVLELAEKLGSDIHAAYIIRKVAFHDNKFWDRQVRNLEGKGEKHLGALEEKCTENEINIETETLKGRAGEKIIECADKRDVDLIVMPRNCRGPVQDSILGSVAKRVAENSVKPVLTLSELEEA